MAKAVNLRKNGRATTAGLTLVELMVVVAMTALLSAIMLPALSTAKEKSRRAVCQSNIRQLLQVLEIYADENEQYLPSCGDDKGYYHSIILSDAVFTNLVDMAGGNSNILYCPNIAFGSGTNTVPQHMTNIGYVIGYSYLAESIAGSSKSPDYTVEPVKLPTSGTPTNALLADANYWTPTSVSPAYFPPLMKVAPHTAAGAAMYANSSFTVGFHGNSVASVGAVGGNVGFADGHVFWRTLPLMQTNQASSIPNDAFGAW
jgi:prepilin-type processing-associated H-X9-DG protein